MTFLESLFDVAGRVTLVSGASRGLGEAMASGLHRAGAVVVGAARSAPARTSGWDFRACDVSDGGAFDSLCRETVSARGRILGYIHSAGITLPEVNQSGGSFRRTLEINLATAYDCARRVVQDMDRGGSIVLVSSIGARLGFPDNPGYAASKGGLSALVRALAVDLAATGIRVNSIAPGYIRTAMTEASYQDADKRQSRLDRTALRRWGQPDDIVGAAVYLLSGASSYVTGQELVVDGGWTARGL